MTAHLLYVDSAILKLGLKWAWIWSLVTVWPYLGCYMIKRTGPKLWFKGKPETSDFIHLRANSRGQEMEEKENSPFLWFSLFFFLIFHLRWKDGSNSCHQNKEQGLRNSILSIFYRDKCQCLCEIKRLSFLMKQDNKEFDIFFHLSALFYYLISTKSESPFLPYDCCSLFSNFNLPNIKFIS
jgi:hypothetical protein